MPCHHGDRRHVYQILWYVIPVPILNLSALRVRFAPTTPVPSVDARGRGEV
jgi:hypothetical protein